MNYDKGEQLTVGRLKEYLNCIPNDVKVFIGIGSEREQAHYLLNEKGLLVFHSDCYMQNAEETNIRTVISFQKK